MIEVAQPDGPFGARGVGELTMIPIPSVIGNAIKHATGVRFKSMPFEAALMVKFLREKKDEV